MTLTQTTLSDYTCFYPLWAATFTFYIRILVAAFWVYTYLGLRAKYISQLIVEA